MRCAIACAAESLGTERLSVLGARMTDQLIGAHNGLHSEQGALPGEHPGRSTNPVIKVHDVVWLEFEKPDLNKAEAFGLAFGFSVVLRTDDELHLRGSDPGAPCVLIRRGARSRFVGPAFVAAEDTDLLRLAGAAGTPVLPQRHSVGGGEGAPSARGAPPPKAGLFQLRPQPRHRPGERHPASAAD